MLTLKKSLCLTKKEAEKISDLLASLAAMSGTIDEQKFDRTILIQ